MNILGLNAYHAEASAALLVDGRLVAAAEEERFVRIKHVTGFPTESVRFCIEAGGVRPEDIDIIAVAGNPWAHWPQRLLAALRLGAGKEGFQARLARRFRMQSMRHAVAAALGVDPKRLQARCHFIEHHRAHLASSFFASGMDEAAVLSLDGLGDFVSAMWGIGRDRRLDIHGMVLFPHSLGFLYTAVTQYLGFLQWGDEYKVMGLAAHGQPAYLTQMRELVQLVNGLQYRLNPSEFSAFHTWVPMQWDSGAPTLGLLFTDALERRLGPRRHPEEPLVCRHADIAASLQAVLEEVVLTMLRRLYERTRMPHLCLAGGIALNCVLNGKITRATPFRRVFVQPAAYDAGNALGAALYVEHQTLQCPRRFTMDHVYWGPAFSDEAIARALQAHGLLAKPLASAPLVEEVAQRLATGKIVGWFQGAMEFGPRALGHRSLLADPRDPTMKQRVNERVKRREGFRPFAPSLPREIFAEYFDEAAPDPFMVMAYPVVVAQRDRIPAVLHVDGTGRPQAVDRATNPLYWELLQAFGRKTGAPVLLNTSFNEQEPIVCRPEEAIACFLRNEIDALVLGPFLVDRPVAQLKAP